MISESTIPVKRPPVVSSSVIGMMVFVFTEVMTFASFISAFNIIKTGFNTWPPLGQPRLPVIASAINSLSLFLSAAFLYLAYQAFVKGQESAKAKKMFLYSLILGWLFFVVQGFEWVRLISYGLTLTSSLYGAFFYMIIGAHALHVLAAAILLTFMYKKLGKGLLQKDSFASLMVFWFFVVGLWPVLYVLVYL